LPKVNLLSPGDVIADVTVRRRAGHATLAGLCALLAGCGHGRATPVLTSPHGAHRLRCDQLDIVQPNWRDPAPADTRVASVDAARRASGLPIVVPAGLGRPRAIYARKGFAVFVYRGRLTGDVLVTETRPALSAADWRKELTAVPAMNGRPDVTGRATAIRIGANVRGLQTASRCVSGSTTDWHTADGSVEIAIEGHTLPERAGSRAARLTERAATPS
jgi:hypothetical protein